MNFKFPARRGRLLAALILPVMSAVSVPVPVVTANPDHSRKLSATLEHAADGNGVDKVDVIVRFRKDPGESERSLVNGLGGQTRRHLRSVRGLAVRISAKKLAKLADHPAVEFVAFDAPMGAAMDVAGRAAGLPSPELPESSLKGAGVTIAVIDSGVAPHPEIKTLIAAADFVDAYDPTLDPANSVDPNGHGTHVAGIMVGDGSRSPGGIHAGIAPQASLVSVRVLDGQGRGQASDVIAGVDWVLAHKDALGIRVVNLSLGHRIYEPAAQDPLVQAVEAVWDAGVVVVCSAGNHGRDGFGTITSPCNSRKVISVGASNDRNTASKLDDLVATYSSRGPTRGDLVAKPDILAPGNRIVSARAAGSTLDVSYPERRVAADTANPDAFEHYEMSGTSMAAPIVAGTAALMLQQDPMLNPGTVKARLMLSARKAGGNPLVQGAGALDITAALQATGSVIDAPSPRVTRDLVTGRIAFENTGVLWSNGSFSLAQLWSTGVRWSDVAGWYLAWLWSDGVLGSDAALWPDGTTSGDATLWPESTLWSEAVLWPDGPEPAGDTEAEAVMWPDGPESQAVGFPPDPD